MINLFGTSDTSVSQGQDIALGKTPQALKMQAARESTGDNADRFYMEQFLTQVINKMVNLIGKKQSSAITVRMFQEEIEDLVKDYPDVAEMYDEDTGKLTITQEDVGDSKWDFEIVSGSTYALDEKQQQDNLSAYMQMFLENGQVIEGLLQRDGMKINFGEMFKRAISNSGIKDWNKILEEIPEEQRAEETLNADAQQFQQAMQQMAQQNVNQVPPQQ